MTSNPTPPQSVPPANTAVISNPSSRGSSTSPATTAASSTAPTPNPLVIAKWFIKQFYPIFTLSPHQVPKFYHPTSQLSYTTPLSENTIKVGNVGTGEILEVMDFCRGAKMDLTSGFIDAQMTVDGGVLIIVLGEMTLRKQWDEGSKRTNDREEKYTVVEYEEGARKFVHTFVLTRGTEKKRNFYVSNDVFRFLSLDLDLEEEEGAVEIEEEEQEVRVRQSSAPVIEEVGVEVKATIVEEVSVDAPEDVSSTDATASVEQEVEVEVKVEDSEPTVSVARDFNPDPAVEESKEGVVASYVVPTADIEPAVNSTLSSDLLVLNREKVGHTDGNALKNASQFPSGASIGSVSTLSTVNTTRQILPSTTSTAADQVSGQKTPTAASATAEAKISPLPASSKMNSWASLVAGTGSNTAGAFSWGNMNDIPSGTSIITTDATAGCGTAGVNKPPQDVPQTINGPNRNGSKNRNGTTAPQAQSESTDKKPKASEEGDTTTATKVQTPASERQTPSTFNKPKQQSKQPTNPNSNTSCSVYIRNIPSSTTEQQISELISQKYPFKIIHVALYASRGFAFVEFANAEAAQGVMAKNQKIKISCPWSEGTILEVEKKNTERYHGNRGGGYGANSY
eukprot:CAMPEP_0195522006 /NCGR_PEP_ID=MMETSP0794_2-20130614/19858_1 /TAXON_ID=515487 /ORGANISM="Stephanopyxis turris, Strain CCMP 815" /LENGTH=623 /DNA_ID=CAMNT_0040651677 /DNA_START=242 /DNA_END=2110 /DNA_ORIENTATION=-